MARPRNQPKHDLIDPEDIVSEGGPEHLTTKKILRERGKFPTDAKDFYPKKIEREENIKAVLDRIERLRKNRLPKPLRDLEITQELKTINGRNFAKVNISFWQDNDPNFRGARVWMKGYLTDNALADPDLPLGAEETIPFELKGQIQKSPSSMVFELTNEEVIFGIEAINEAGEGSGLSSMPTQTLTLDGV